MHHKLLFLKNVGLFFLKKFVDSNQGEMDVPDDIVFGYIPQVLENE